MSFGLLILAAGFSERMGKTKFLLKFNENENFIEKIFNQIDKNFIKETVIVLNSENYRNLSEKIINRENISAVENKYPERGRFYSVILGTQNFKKAKNIFIHNADNPFLENDVLKILSENIEKNNYCVPTFKNKGGHPILISETIKKQISSEKSCNFILKEYLTKFNSIRIEVESPNILVNINTITDYEKLRQNRTNTI